MKITQTAYHLVIGLGISGMSMAKFLHAIGETVVATDLDASRADQAEQLNKLGIQTQIGFHDQATFNQAKVMVPSPGIPLTSKYIETAAQNGIPVTGELDIFQANCQLPVIAITGTNGKTTTTELVGHLLETAGKKPFVGGNIGTPLVDLLSEKKEADVVVAEVSSFQLDLCRDFAPKVGVLLNITEDHMDRYETFEAYEDSKWSLFERQNTSDTAVLNRSLSDFTTRSSKLESQVKSFSADSDLNGTVQARIHADGISIQDNPTACRLSTVSIPALFGTHNRENAAAAVLACLGVGASVNGIQKGLETFKALPHRISFVSTIDGVSFYNDSKATNTDAVIRALQCFDTPVVLILGGREKGTDFGQLLAEVKQSVKAIMAIGESKENIETILGSVCPVTKVTSMADAVKKAFHAADKNGTVLLSPACASFDMYDDYVHRGNDFIHQINQIKGRVNE